MAIGDDQIESDSADFAQRSDDLQQSETLARLRRFFSEAWIPDVQSRLYDQMLEDGDTSLIGTDAWVEAIEKSGIAAFNRELSSLRAEVAEKAAALYSEKASGEAKEERLRDLERTLQRLTDQHDVSYLLSRIGARGQRLLLEDPDFRRHFSKGEPHESYVLSVDIRRSTELMLKAEQPLDFAKFIQDLADMLRQIVLNKDGVFDKFTGDGILAVFPDFYAGAHAGEQAIATAVECHQAFTECYKRHRRAFVSVLLSTGLGIGLDFGRVHMVQVGDDLTVVGTPVVYACRMAGTAAGTTFANHRVFDKVGEKLTDKYVFRETEIDIKHEGRTLAYAIESLPPSAARLV